MLCGYECISFFSSLDYAFDIELFSSSESFMIIIGYVVSYVTKSNANLDNTADIVEDTR